MKRPLKVVLAAGAVLFLALVGYLAYRHHQTPGAEGREGATGQTEGQVARVKTVQLKRGTIESTILVFGSVIPAPGAQTTISVPFESVINHIMVNEGQAVSPGDPLVELGPSPDSLLKFREAREAYDVAAQGLKNMERKFQLKLATNDQLLQARQAAETAGLTLNSLKNQGIDSQSQITAKVEGLVIKVSADEGALVAAGAPIVQLVPRHRLEIKLGVEPEDIERVHEGTAVSLSAVLGQTTAISGAVRKISRSVSPSTRLVDIFVSIPSSSPFLLGQYVSGRIVIGSAEGIVAPRTAILPEEGKYVLFLAKNGVAVKQVVLMRGENRDEAVVEGSGIRPGDEVVSLGNYELKDNMRITGGP